MYFFLKGYISFEVKRISNSSVDFIVLILLNYNTFILWFIYHKVQFIKVQASTNFTESTRCPPDQVEAVERWDMLLYYMFRNTYKDKQGPLHKLQSNLLVKQTHKVLYWILTHNSSHGFIMLQMWMTSQIVNWEKGLLLLF